MKHISTEKWGKLTPEEKLKIIDKMSKAKEPTKQFFTFFVELGIKARTENEAEDRLRKLLRGKYLLVIGGFKRK